jgi:uncharacterized tellurite resistance protein B-like protein
MVSGEAHSLVAKLQSDRVVPLAPVAAEAPREDLLAWLVKLSMADGVTTYAEREKLDAVAAKHHVPKRELDRLISAAASGQLEPSEPRDRDEARRWLEGMVAIAVADGRIQPDELALLRSAGAKLGYGDYDLDQMVRRQRHDLFITARPGACGQQPRSLGSAANFIDADPALQTRRRLPRHRLSRMAVAAGPIDLHQGPDAAGGRRDPDDRG